MGNHQSHHPDQKKSRPNELDWLDNLSPEIQQKVRGLYLKRSIKTATHLYGKHDESGKIYQIESGEVRLFFVDHTGREILIKICKAGEWVGAIAGIDHRPYPVHAETRGATELNFLTVAQMDALRVQHPEIETALLIYSCSNIRNLFQLFQEAVMLPVGNRIAARICWLADEKGARGGVGVPDLVLSQEDLGLMTGASRQAVNKGIASLREEGLISTSYGKISVLDMAGLRAFSTEY